jgi:hypothetical protein
MIENTGYVSDKSMYLLLAIHESLLFGKGYRYNPSLAERWPSG